MTGICLPHRCSTSDSPKFPEQKLELFYSQREHVAVPIGSYQHRLEHCGWHICQNCSDSVLHMSSDLSLRVRKQKSVPVGRKKTCESLFRQKSMSAPHWWIFYKDSFSYWNFQLNPSIFWQFLLIMSSSIQFCINFALKLMFLSKFFLKFCRLKLARFLAKVKLFVKYSPVLLHPHHILHCHLTTCTDGDWR